MGTDCTVVCKIKGQEKYKVRQLDRYYVFQGVGEHDGLPYETVIVGDTRRYKFGLHQGLEWCKERLLLLNSISTAETLDVDVSYHIHWVEQLQGFLWLVAEDFDFLAIYPDTSQEDEDLFIWGKGKVEIIET